MPTKKKGPILIGWAEIAKMSPYSEATLKRKFGKEMLRNGIVIKSYIGKVKRCVIWGYPQTIGDYFMQRQRLYGSV